MTFNGVTLLACIGIVGVFLLTVEYLSWRSHDRFVRERRLRHVDVVREILLGG